MCGLKEVMNSFISSKKSDRSYHSMRVSDAQCSPELFRLARMKAIKVDP